MSNPESQMPAIPENLEELSVPEVEAIARQVIAHAREVLQRKDKLPNWLENAVHRVRDAYNEVLTPAGDEDGDGDGGDPVIFVGFKEVLRETPKKEPVGRPFPRRRGYVIQGETLRGGNRIFHRRR
ncbi:MAG: hypothetical protein V1876_03940 [Candidatus Peregrinibacteria bacterium]